MSSYHNLIVSSAQADRSELAGYRVASGAKAEITQNAISREIGNNAASRFSRPTYRFALLLAASVALAIAGIHGASAQDQSAMFADADGIEPPDMGVAYSRTATSSVANAVTSPELAALLMDADGMEPPDSGFAVALPVRSSVASADRLPSGEHADFMFDVDGIEPPDTGVAYLLPATTSYASSQTETLTDVTGFTVYDDGIEPPDIGIAYDTDTAYKAYVERQQQKNRVAVQAGGTK